MIIAKSVKIEREQRPEKGGKESAHIQNRTRGTNEEITKPKSIMVSMEVRKYQNRRLEMPEVFRALVARANHLCCAFFAIPSSSDCSEAATDPQGYSAPTPMPRRKLHRIASVALSMMTPSRDSPTCTEHSKETVGTMVGTGRGCREAREQSNDSSSGHLGRKYLFVVTGDAGRR
jgi:hypothetical protein